MRALVNPGGSLISQEGLLTFMLSMKDLVVYQRNLVGGGEVINIPYI